MTMKQLTQLILFTIILLFLGKNQNNFPFDHTKGNYHTNKVDHHLHDLILALPVTSHFHIRYIDNPVFPDQKP